MKTLAFLFITFFSYNFMIAQSTVLSHSSINVGGGSLGSVDFTLGQAAIATLYSDNGVVTQGFQQPGAGIDTYVDELLVVTASISPNPTTDHLVVFADFKSPVTGYVNLTSADGKSLYSERFFESALDKIVDLKAFHSGMYIVTIVREDGTTIYSEKILKY